MWHTRWLAPALVALAALAAAAQADAASYTWSGAGATPAWSASANWNGAAAPAAGEAVDALEFPALTGASPHPSSNDRDGLSVGSLAVDGVGYMLDGKAVALGAGGLTVTPPADAAPGSSNTIAIPLA